MGAYISSEIGIVKCRTLRILVPVSELVLLSIDSRVLVYVQYACSVSMEYISCNAEICKEYTADHQ
jgi:hypothetical protein